MNGGFSNTFGKAKAAINLTTSILENPEYQYTRRKVCRLLSKQIEAYNFLMAIPNTHTRRACLKMFHDKFVERVTDLPEIVKTHTRCVETGIYRKLLKVEEAVKDA